VLRRTEKFIVIVCRQIPPGWCRTPFTKGRQDFKRLNKKRNVNIRENMNETGEINV